MSNFVLYKRRRNIEGTTPVRCRSKQFYLSFQCDAFAKSPTEQQKTLSAIANVFLQTSDEWKFMKKCESFFTAAETFKTLMVNFDSNTFAN